MPDNFCFLSCYLLHKGSGSYEECILPDLREGTQFLIYADVEHCYRIKIKFRSLHISHKMTSMQYLTQLSYMYLSMVHNIQCYALHGSLSFYTTEIQMRNNTKTSLLHVRHFLPYS